MNHTTTAPYMAHVAPGKTETIAWQFTKAGNFNFGGLIPGHFDLPTALIRTIKGINMKTFNSFSVAVAFTALTLFTGTVHAQMNMDHGNMAGTKMNSQASTVMTDGEVRKVDMDAKKITIRHGAIENLGMPPMTMVFQVKDPALLKQVKAGDKVRFNAEKIGGAFTITHIENTR